MPKNLLVIEDKTIKVMMQDPRVMQLLPCLKGPQMQLKSTQKGGRNCTRCQAKKRQIASDAIRVARDCIKNTRGSRLTELKQLLGTKQIQIIARNSKNARVKYTI